MEAASSAPAEAAAPPAGLRVVMCSDHPAVAAVLTQVLPAMGHTVVAFVSSGKRRADYLGAVQAMAPLADVLVTQRPRRLASWLQHLDFDVLLTLSFPLRLPADVLALPKLGAVNIHPALLPAYRGTMTANWHLLNGEQRIGITMHRMTPQFDDGPILAQAAVDIDPDDDIDTMMYRLFSTGPQVLAEGFARLAAGDPGIPQDETLASYYGVIDASIREIAWDLPARTIHNRVRAFSGEFTESGIYASVEGERLRISRTRVRSEEGQEHPAGTLMQDADGTRLVQCTPGLLEIVESAPATVDA